VLAIAPGHLRLPQAQGIDGPLFLGIDTHALSVPAFQCARSAGGQRRGGHARGRTNTRRRPAISHAILVYNRGRTAGLADGIVVTPSHNPPDRRRLQVQPAQRRAGGQRRHRWIENEANALLEGGSEGACANAFRKGAARRDHAPARLPQRLRRAISAA
jgi:phosphoglucomutase